MARAPPHFLFWPDADTPYSRNAKDCSPRSDEGVPRPLQRLSGLLRLRAVLSSFRAQEWRGEACLL
eukprot:15446182-Alexandrium_andersonii.AAC.1